jgi:hypothetical protein
MRTSGRQRSWLGYSMLVGIPPFSSPASRLSQVNPTGPKGGSGVRIV